MSPGVGGPGARRPETEGGLPRSTLQPKRSAPRWAAQAGADVTILTRAGHDLAAYLDRGGFLPAQFAHAVVADAPMDRKSRERRLSPRSPIHWGSPASGIAGIHATPSVQYLGA